jgi:hypothetical protein
MRRFSDWITWTWCALVPLSALMACGSDDKDSSGEGMGGAAITFGGATGDSGAATTAGGGAAGASMGQGGMKNSGGAKATGGARSEGGAEATGGSASGGAPPMAGAAGMGATGTQAPGAICSNDTNCSQAQGKAVCCNSTCTLGGCSTTTFLPCNSAADCAAYGGGKICCEEMTSSQTMRFCTKQSACMGRVLP